MTQALTRSILEHIRSGRLDAALGAELLGALKEQARQDRPGAPEEPSAARRGDEPIAVVGMSGSFPDAPDVETLWDNLVAHRDMVREVEEIRWRTGDHYSADPNEPNATDCKWQGMVADVDAFDPLFFSLSPREARYMDPQQRLLIQESWRAVEDAGYTPEKLSEGTCGVFVGVTHGDYDFRTQAAGLDLGAQAMTGTLISMLAARVSYHMNLTGPNLSIDTACSSSLVALCQAAQALREGSCDAALAGGVSVLTTPRLFVMAGKGGMLSRTGRCRTFDESADGFVPSDAVGVVLLKRLSDAERDHDHVYGVIEAFGINHDGRTNGMTAPSPVSQYELISGIYERDGIDPRTISYVEAHGTGTRLGDPIEVSALTKAFRRYTGDRQFCRIGSVKSNVGHALGASGIVSFIKVMCCLNQRMLPGNLHYQTPNRQIDFSQTPFEVCAENVPWEPGPAGSRRAAISSFGLSGTNAHMVVREYLPPAGTVPGRSQQPSTELVTVSAQSTIALRDNIAGLVRWLDEHPDADWADVVLTLGDGRQAMDHRICVVASSVEELRRALSSYDDQAAVDAQATSVQAGLLGGCDADDRLREVVDALRDADGTQRERLVRQLRDRVLAGYDPPAYAAIHPVGQASPRRLAMPTYRFVGERYWIDTVPARGVGDASSRVRIEIPRGASYLDDHKFAGAAVVPGARWLDLIDQHLTGRRAVPDTGVRVLRDVRWASLAGPAETLELSCREEGREHAIEVTGADGTLVVSARQAEPDAQDASVFRAGRVDTRLFDDADALRIEGSALYEHFLATGMAYGPSFRGITSIDVHDSHAVAHLDVPGVADLEPRCVLLPHAFDAVLQTVAAFKFTDADDPDAWYLPHSVGEIVYTDAFGDLATAVVRKSDREVGGTLRSFDIGVFDASGAPVARIVDYRVEKVRRTAQQFSGQETGGDGLVFLTPVFVDGTQAATAPAGPSAQVAVPWPIDIDDTVREVSCLGPGVRADVVIRLPDPGDSAAGASAHDDLIRPVFELVAALVKRTRDLTVRMVLVVPDSYEKAAPVFHAFEGLARSVRHEEPRMTITTLYCGHGAEALDAAVAMESEVDDAALTVHHAGGRQIWTLERVDLAPIDRLPSNVREDGVFLITGGLGGLGMLLATDLLDRGTPTIVLAGRSEPDEAKLARVRSHATGAGRVDYLRCDVGDAEACDRLVVDIVASFGRLDGVFYCAGAIRDAYLTFKPWSEARDVLAVKSVGLANIDRATAGLPLSFFVGYSSIGSLLGNVGQTDYAMANAYMDAYLGARAERVRLGEASGRSLSVNWPLWSDGGMRPDDASLAVMYDSFGLGALSSRDGLGSLYALLESDLAQCAVLAGDPGRLTTRFVDTATWASDDHARRPDDDDPSQTGPDDRDDRFERDASRLIRGIIARGLEIEPDRIVGDRPFEHYGLDSVMIVTINALLDQAFPKLSKTLLYEYQNLDDLTGYFLAHRADDLERLLGARAEPRDDQDRRPRGVGLEVPSGRPGGDEPTEEPVEADDPIAVVGMSGRFPQANSVGEFWENLTQGRDCIVPIPPDRWDHERGYFDPDGVGTGTYASRWGGFIDGIRDCDPLMFGMSPRDAENTDPQERIFLQTCWETLQEAGYGRESVRRTRTGVFVGVMYNHYQLFGAQESSHGVPVALNSDSASIANRVSYTFDLSGPSLALDSMCSSSISSIHLACQAIRDGDCDMALAGGVNTTLHENKYQLLGSGNFLSSDGRCRSYGEGGDGYVPGEGVGCVLLKPLSRARADGDHVYALVRGSALNHGGKTNGYTVPNPIAQAAVVAEAMNRSGLVFDDLSYVEGHGTGTALGDPIEVSGLTRALGEHHAGGPCPLGSVKSNIGHLESAAGIASLIKVLLMMRHRSYVPSLHSSQLNANIDFDAAPFEVVQRVAPWEAGGDRGRRRALVTGFGAGGSNGALVVEEGEDEVRSLEPCQAQQTYLFLLSARTVAALDAYVADLRVHVDELGQGLVDAEGPAREQALLLALQRTLLVGRDSFTYRLLIEAGSLSELAGRLSRITRDGLASGETDGSWVFRETGASGRPVPQAEADAYREELGRGDLARLGMRWVTGHVVAWGELPARFGAAGRLSGVPWPRPNLKPYWYDTHLDRSARPEDSTRRPDSPSPAAVGRGGRSDASRPARDGTPGTTRSRSQEILESLTTTMRELAAAGPRPEVRLEIDEEGVAVVTMDQPEHNNSFTPELIEALMVAFWRIWADDRVKAVVLTGTDRVFSMGGTKDQLIAISRQEISFTDAPFLYAGLLLTKVPVVTAIRGHASGGGFMLGLFGDIVVLCDQGIYTSPFTKYGFTPGMGATYILQRKLGRNLALEMMMTARSYTGAELGARGAGVKVHAPEGLLDEAVAIARTIASHPRETSVELKAHMLGTDLEDLLATIEQEDAMHERTFVADNVDENIAAYYISDDRKSRPPDAPYPTASHADDADASDVDTAFLEDLLEMVEQGTLTPEQALFLDEN